MTGTLRRALALALLMGCDRRPGADEKDAGIVDVVVAPVAPLPRECASDGSRDRRSEFATALRIALAARGYPGAATQSFPEDGNALIIVHRQCSPRMLRELWTGDDAAIDAVAYCFSRVECRSAQLGTTRLTADEFSALTGRRRYVNSPGR